MVTAALTTLALALVSGALRSYAGPTPPGSGDLNVPTTCKPYNLVGLKRISATGKVAALPLPKSLDAAKSAAALDSANGRRYDFELDGTSVSRKIPPAGWSPKLATNTQLKLYGFHVPRPAARQTAARTNWNATYGNLHVTLDGPPCSSNGAAISTLTSPNWAGGLNTGPSGKYYMTDMKWVQPTFLAACISASRYSIWSGTGGYYSHSGLMQLGTELDGSTLNGAHFWWEFVKDTTGVTQQFVDSKINVTAGDTVQVVNYWYPGGPFEEFEWTNLTQSKSYTLDVSSAGAHSATYYYTGDTADFVTEQTAKSLAQPPDLFYLRKVSGAVVRIPAADSNENPIRTWPGSQVDQKNGSLLVQDSNYDNSHGWNDEWYRCN